MPGLQDPVIIDRLPPLQPSRRPPQDGPPLPFGAGGMAHARRRHTASRAFPCLVITFVPIFMWEGATRRLMVYFGPELVAPAASILAGLVGMLLMFWQRVTSGVRRVLERGRLLVTERFARRRGTSASARGRAPARGRSGDRR